MPVVCATDPTRTMKQVFQSLRRGVVEIQEVPCPLVGPGQLLLRTRHSLISAGTERMLVEFGKAGWIGKARSQPDRVRQVLDKIRTDGIEPAFRSVADRLSEPLALGYSNMGTVLAVGEGVAGYAKGDRVVSNGPHAEVVSIRANLCARVPGNVADEDAVFAIVAAIGLQGIRLLQPTLGESVVVIGLGLIGLAIVQLLLANGCRVLGIDVDPSRLAAAGELGAQVVGAGQDTDVVARAMVFSRGRGVDGVVIAAATQSSDPVRQAARMCRKRGRIILVGVAGLALSRSDFYEKELTFQVSCSYGPGRYDPAYEEGGQDYPFGFVRWTLQRNIEAVLDTMASGAIAMAGLISHRFPIENAASAYDLIVGDEPSMAVLLDYGGSAVDTEDSVSLATVRLGAPDHVRTPVVSFLGAGNFANRTLIPAFRKSGARLRSVVSRGGVSGAHAGRRHGFEQTTTDGELVLQDDETSVVVIATRHDTHADLACRALAAGKDVFVEKPLALRSEDVDRVQHVASIPLRGGNPPRLMVGYNRRFSPLVQKMRSLLDTVRGPKAVIMTVNAGSLPSTHWTLDPATGGGRIIGEACHFVDLARYLVGARIVDVDAIPIVDAAAGPEPDDGGIVLLHFEDGSTAALQYLTNGHRALEKERVEVFCAGRVLKLENFRSLTGYGWPRFSKRRVWRQDKGHDHCVAAFIEAVRQGGESPIPLAELVEVARATIEADRILRGRELGA